MERTTGEALERLVAIMGKLRAEGGCPWDREQDLRSLRPYLIEEAYEVLDEMDRASVGGDWASLCEELGDLLFQVVFHAQLATERGKFQMKDVCEAISGKIESRHPHVFGELKVSGSEQVLANWAKLKAEEKRKKTGRSGSVLDGVPTAAPSLLRAERLTEKASRIGFDWPDIKGVRAKLDEELGELDEAIRSNDRDALEHELGDVLFSLANLARFIKTPPEDALRAAITRFVSRFSQIEQGLAKADVPFGTATLQEMEALWQEAKAQEKAIPPPRRLPRAGVTTITVTTTSLKATQEAWDALCDTLGFRKERGSPTEARYVTGDLELCFKLGELEQERNLELTLSAPSHDAVERLAKALPLGMTLLCSLPDSGPAGGVVFQDPAGVRWRYKYGTSG
jgi:ATP diphosphatase